MGRCLHLISAIVLIVAVAFAVIDFNRDSFYVFDPDVLHKVAAEAAAMNITSEEKFHRIAVELHKIYPQYIDLDEEWMFNVAGGAMGHMTLLHCSITEYVIIFGSPIGTEGFSGRFLSDDYFTIIEGEQWSYYAGEVTARVFKPGDRNVMPRGHATGYRMPGKTYALGSYFRGPVSPRSLYFCSLSTLIVPTTSMCIHLTPCDLTFLCAQSTLVETSPPCFPSVLPTPSSPLSTFCPYGTLSTTMDASPLLSSSLERSKAPASGCTGWNRLRTQMYSSSLDLWQIWLECCFVIVSFLRNTRSPLIRTWT